MIGKLRQWTQGQAVYFGAAAVVVLVNPPYLAKVGPASLRLSPIVHIETNVVAIAQPPAPTAEAPPAPPAPVKTNAEPAAPLAVLTTNAAPAPAPASTEQMISPQMFLQYFNATPTNAKTAPMEFTPPGSASAASGGSSSTYQQ